MRKLDLYPSVIVIHVQVSKLSPSSSPLQLQATGTCQHYCHRLQMRRIKHASFRRYSIGSAVRRGYAS